MGVYIKGMEMPNRCCECLLAKLSPTGESIICNYLLSTVPWDERPFDCPLVPVPPHGRLIDADAMEKECCHGCKNEFHKYENCIDCVLANAPTIIPADPPKEET